MSVFANSLEVSGKAQSNQIIAGFPSVCLSPPSPPAGPIPIPYPMFTDASKTSQGTTTVKIKGKEVGKKNVSTYSESKGNEAATRSFGMDVVTHTLSGATKHQAYSFDVKAEGAGVNRFTDLTTTNHNNPATAVTIDGANLSVTVDIDEEYPCKGLEDANKATRKKMKETKHPDYVKTTANGNTTITHAQFTPAHGGQVSYERASSRQVMSQYDDSFVEGLTPEEREENRVKKGEQAMSSNVCGGHVYKRGFFMPHSSHTEARILEQLTKDHPPGQGGSMGTVVFGINWPGGPGKGLSTKSPCPECQALICAALECFEIFVCDEENDAIDQREKCGKKKDGKAKKQKSKK